MSRSASAAAANALRTSAGSVSSALDDPALMPVMPAEKKFETSILVERSARSSLNLASDAQPPL